MQDLLIPERTLPQMLRHWAQATPDRVAIHQKDFGIWKPVTWAQYFERAARVGLGLRALGLNTGSHVGVISENRIEWVLTQMGCGVTGMVTVGVYPTSPSNEVAYVVGHADIEVVICEDQEQTDKVFDALAELPALRKIVVMETKGLRSYPAEQREKIITFEDLEKLGATGDMAQVQATLDAQQLDEIGLMIYTSGSTGKPKGAMISYRNIRGSTIGMVDRLGLNQDTTHLSYLPLCHVAEQLVTCFGPVYMGSQVNFGESIRTVQEDLREVAPNTFLGVPRIWEKMHAAISIKMQDAGAVQQAFYTWALKACCNLAEKPRPHWTFGERAAYVVSYWLVFRALQNFVGLRNTRICLTGAAPIPPDVVRFFRTIGVPLIEVYGLTESSGVLTGHLFDDVKIGAVGVPVRGVEYRLGDHDELQVKGDMVFAGYYKNPEATAQAIQDGWLHTSDVVRMVEGQIKIVDRLKDIMITAGGKNLTPSEIENTMKSSPFIKECIIVAEARKYVGALVQIDFETVGKWAEARRIPFTHFRSLVETPQVRELIDHEIRQGNERLAQVAQIRKFHLLTKELDHDDGEVTATMKVRRSSIYKTYATEIESLFS